MPVRPAPLLAAILLLTALIAGACGSTPAKAVDGTKLGGKIAVDLAQRYTIARPTVTCPTGEANVSGTTFACHTVVDDQDLAINAVVHMPDDVRFQPASSVISTASTARAIQTRFASTLGADLQVSCGTQQLLVVAVGSSVRCTATAAGTVRKFLVTATDLKGDVGLSLLPPATGPGSTTPPVTAPSTGSTVPGKTTLPGD